MSYKMSSLQREPELHKDILQLNADGSITAKKEVKIIFPETWVGRDLAWIEGEILVLAKCMVLTDNRYTVMNECACWPLTPTSINMTEVEKVPCYELVFEAGSVVCPNFNLVMDEDLLYYTFHEFIEKGRVPPYFEDTDLYTIFINSVYHTNYALAGSNSINELIAGTITRQKDNELLHYRLLDKSTIDRIKDKPAYIAFKSPVYMASSSLTKMSTAYFKDGVTSALLTETTVVEPMERIARA